MTASQTKRIGLFLVIGGVAMYGCWHLWAATRTEVPLRMPISMAIGQVRSREFRVNLSEPYLIEIEVERKIPFHTLNCLLGTYTGRTSTNIGDCPGRPSVVKATWSVMSGRRVVASGSSDDYRDAAWGNGAVSRGLGYFQAQSGRRYVLVVNVLKDGSALAAGNPQLVVEVASDFDEGIMVGDALFFLGSSLLVAIGVIVLSIAWRTDRRARRAPIAPS